MASGFQLWAHPWWVNLLLLAPVLSFLGWRRGGLGLSRRQLFYLAVFGVSFGFVEAAVVVYLRAGLALAGSQAALQPPALPANYQQAVSSLALFPRRLLAIEICREAATIIMLVSVALLAAAKARERWACFLGAFAAWDLTYYAALRVMLGWPSSLRDLDVLFLIPVPWVSQVWFPVLVSALALAAIALSTRATRSATLKQALPADLSQAAPKGNPTLAAQMWDAGKELVISRRRSR